MKAILISIKPQYCELIVAGKKTIEVRKTKPNIPTPFKVYIYCTKQKQRFSIGKHIYAFADNLYVANGVIKYGDSFEDVSVDTMTLNGKVIGEFVCNKIDNYDDDIIHSFSREEYSKWNDFELDKACIHPEDFENYANDNWLYGWHISNLKIYDKPKDLNEFKKINRDCVYSDLGLVIPNCDKCKEPTCFIQRPPQSWCYVEEVKNADKKLHNKD